MNAIALLALAAGCTTPATDSAAGSSTCAITPGPGVDPSDLDCLIGTGSEAFVPVDEGAEVPYYEGLQGAWHVFISLRARGIAPGDPADLSDPDTPYVAFLVYRGGEVFGGVEGFLQPRGLSPAEEGWYEFVGETVLLQIGERMEADGAEVELAYELSSSDGSLLSARVPATLSFSGLEGGDTGDTGGD